MSDADADLLARSCAYVKNAATPRRKLAAAAGLGERDLAAIRAAGAMPTPTYVVFDHAIRSPIRTLGDAPTDGGDEYFCPSVVPWLRRAALIGPDTPKLLEHLQVWFAESFLEALCLQAADARLYGWSHLFDATGAVDAEAMALEVRTLCADWLDGSWAVCLRRWDGYHVVTKNLERARIAALTDDGTRRLLEAERMALFNAIERLDSVMLPFAPYERPFGTPGRYIDALRELYRV